MDALNNHELYVPPRTLKPKDLVEGKPYPLVKMMRVMTKFGGALLAHIMFTQDEKCGIFLPQSYAKALTDEALAEINSKTMDLILVGAHYKTFKYELKERQQ